MSKFGKGVVRKVISAAVLSGIVAFTSACGGQSGAAVPTDASVTATESETQTPNPSPSATIDPALGVPAPTKGLSVTGDYLQSTISADDPAMTLNDAVLHESVRGWDRAELLAAQQTIITFIAEEGIDSPLNGGGMKPDEWWAQNKHRIHPDYHAEFQKEVLEGQPFVMNEKWQGQYDGKYRYITSPDKPRIHDLSITPKVVWLLDEGTLGVQADVSYKMPTTPNVGKTGTGIQSSAGTMSYSVGKDPNTGKWLINGFQHKMKVTEG